MSLVCFVSQKGAPGVTLTSLAVAASWYRASRRRAVLVEADPAGGVLAVRYRFGLEPGLVTLAAAARAGRRGQAGSVWDHARRLPGGLPVVLAPDGPDQVHAALRASGEAMGDWLGALSRVDVVADLGRLGLGSPALPLARRADAVLMVARPEVEQLQPAARRLATLATECRQVGWVLVGEEPHAASEVEDAYGFDVVGVIVDDPRAAAGVERSDTSRKIARSALIRSATAIAGDLIGWWLDHPDQSTDQSTEPGEEDDVEDVVALMGVPIGRRGRASSNGHRRERSSR